ncbi:lasso RiPP family leader peptide-containing protein [Rhodococcus erythropolis]|nr:MULTISPECIES: lasso RiPP family leader peptide-containing protein [Rhodococcus erythropolis group]MCD2104876.1 lasso RiPP family leader peptide-containing protein [Rhodococcus qingshengii]MCZ4524996.1 lasso RiPP family leader peptide-containing protein [Rhodococcus erythropolis]
MEKNEYVRPMIAEVGDFSADTADNRPYWGVDWHITGRA